MVGLGVARSGKRSLSGDLRYLDGTTFAILAAVTLVVGMNLGTYALLAADTRVSYYPNGVFQYLDMREKIQPTSMGLITATGFTGFLDPVEKLLLSRPIESSEDIVDVVAEVKADVVARPWMSDPRVVEGIEASSWLFTYRTPDIENPRAHLLRLAQLGAHTGWRLALGLCGYGCMNRPVGAPNSLLAEQCELANQTIRPLDSLDNFADNFRQHYRTCLNIFRAVSEKCATVSPTFQIGLTFVSGGSCTTGVIDANSPPERLIWRDM